MHRHPVDLRTGTKDGHDEAEQLPAQQYHVECSDCHNPHQVNGINAPLANPPNINGRLAGVRGINKDTLGVVIASAEYEICFKCHGGPSAGTFSGVTELKPDRLIPDPDQRERFAVTNPSFHPVTADRQGTGASLITTLQSSMIRIYCSDCHNNDQGSKMGGAGPNGPHGSQFPHILMARYEMPPAGTPLPGYSASYYALCYRCHDVNVIMGSASGFVNKGTNEHVAHVQVRGYPCFTCHDPHGVPTARGATVTNNAHLINFDKGYTVSPTVPAPVYLRAGPGAGSCTVSCHSANPKSYGP